MPSERSNGRAAGLLAVLPGSWGPAQTGVADAVPSPTGDIAYSLLAIELPPGERVARLRLEPLASVDAGSGIVVGAVSTFRGTASPLAVSTVWPSAFTAVKPRKSLVRSTVRRIADDRAVGDVAVADVVQRMVQRHGAQVQLRRDPADPADLRVRRRIGRLEGFELEPMIRQAWQPPYYHVLCEQAGLEKEVDLFMWEMKIGQKDKILPIIWDLADNLEPKHEIKIHRMSRRHLRKHLEEVSP